VILLLDSPDREQIVEAFRNGASGVFFRSDSLERLWKSIRSVHLGQVWASSRELQYLLEELVQTMPFHVVDVQGGVLLTEREDQVVRLVAEGYTNREISKELGLSEHTVKNYIFRVFDKLGVSTRVELALYAMNQRQGGAVAARGSGKLAS
jgi:DNA-binding NarL/FixJ family response regulator